MGRVFDRVVSLPDGRPVGSPLDGRRRWPAWVRELGIAVGFYYAYDLVRGFISGSTSRAQRDGLDLLHWERVLHLDPEHALNNVLGHVTWLAVPACYFYATLHFVVTPAVLVWAFRRHRSQYWEVRTALAIVTASALIGFWRFPTAPPRLLTASGFHDTLADLSRFGWWGSDASVPRGAAALANEYAAMPSLHVAWALWCGIVIVRLARTRWVRGLGMAYPAATVLVVLGTANHYLLDAVAGVLMCVIGLGIARYVRRISGSRSIDGKCPSRIPHVAASDAVSSLDEL